MHKPSAKNVTQAQLRVNAQEQLQRGQAPSMHAAPMGAQALSLLHDLACQPASSGDALKLLHELQVHQVELDLQSEQAKLDHGELTAALSHLAALFDQAPFGYITLTPEGCLIKANRIAKACLGGATGEALLQRVEDVLMPADRLAATLSFERMRQGSTAERFTARFLFGGGLQQVMLTAMHGERTVLMAWLPIDQPPGG